MDLGLDRKDIHVEFDLIDRFAICFRVPQVVYKNHREVRYCRREGYAHRSGSVVNRSRIDIRPRDPAIGVINGYRGITTDDCRNLDRSLTERSATNSTCEGGQGAITSTNRLTADF